MLAVVSFLTVMLVSIPGVSVMTPIRDKNLAIANVEPIIDVDAENGAADGVGGTLHTSVSNDGDSSPDSYRAADSEPAGPNSDFQVPLSPNSGLGQVQLDAWCGWSDVAAVPPANDPAWAGNDPSTGTLRFRSCPILLPGTPGAPGNLEGRPVEYQFAPNGVAAAPPPPNPATLAQQAVALLRVPIPAIGAGPDRNRLAVNLWSWLWVDDPGPLSSTVSLAGVTVIATATLESVTWSLGEPAPTGGAYAPGPPVTVTCQGTGTAPPPDYDWKAEPPCGHKYTWMSTADRTGGTGKWPVIATTNWAVTWQSNTGVSGATTLSATGTDALEIGEYRTVLVQGAGG